MIKKNFNHMIYGSFFVVLFVLIWRFAFIFFDYQLEIALSINCICAFFVYSWIFYCIYKMDKGIVNVYSGFVLLSFVFYFGQHVVVLLGKKDVLLTWFRSILDERIPNYNRINTGYYILIVMLIVNIGVIFGLCFGNYNKIVKKVQRPELYNKCVEFVASVILVVVTIPTYYKLYTDARNTIELGYKASLEVVSTRGVLGVCYFLSYFFLPAIYMLLICYSNSNKKYVVLFLYGIYAILYLCTGSRFRLFESIVAIALIYNHKYKKIKLGDMVKLGVIGIIGLFFFMIVRSAREVIKTTDSLMELVAIVSKKISEEGIIIGALIETGTTFQVVDVVLFKCPDIVDFCYGKSFFAAVLRIFPSFFRFGFNLDSVNTSKIFSPLYLSEIEIGMGSSFIAESYFNLGLFSVFFVFILGVLIGKMLTSFNEKGEAANDFQLYRYAYLSSLLCFSVRTDLVAIPRYYVYYVLLIQILIALMYQSKMKYWSK